MSNDLSVFIIKRIEKEIKDLHAKTASLDKKVVILEYKLDTNKIEVEKNNKDIAVIKDRNMSKFLSNNWTKIPQAAILVGGLLWFANWIYDLPSPSQQSNIDKLVAHIDTHTKAQST